MTDTPIIDEAPAAGEVAHLHGWTLGECPHPPGPDQDAWRRAWLDAESYRRTAQGRVHADSVKMWDDHVRATHVDQTDTEWARLERELDGTPEPALPAGGWTFDRDGAIQHGQDPWAVVFNQVHHAAIRTYGQFSALANLTQQFMSAPSFMSLFGGWGATTHYYVVLPSLPGRYTPPPAKAPPPDDEVLARVPVYVKPKVARAPQGVNMLTTAAPYPPATVTAAPGRFRVVYCPAHPSVELRAGRCRLCTRGRR